MNVKITPKHFRDALENVALERKRPIFSYANHCVISCALKDRGFSEVATGYFAVTIDEKLYLLDSKAKALVAKFDVLALGVSMRKKVVLPKRSITINLRKVSK